LKTKKRGIEEDKRKTKASKLFSGVRDTRETYVADNTHLFLNCNANECAVYLQYKS
jgi:hypothetical protein